MFKQRKLKGSNFAQDMGALGTSDSHGRSDSKDDDEPLVQKKLKTTTGAKFSVNISCFSFYYLTI